MDTLKNFTRWARNSVLSTWFAILVGAPLVIGGIALAATPTTYDVHNVPEMTLAAPGALSAATTGITINNPRRNNVVVSYPTLTGGVLEFRQGVNVEQIYYSRAIDNGDDTFTLTGTVIRNLDWNDCTAYVSDGAGRRFTPGAAVRLVNDCRLYNRTVKTDRLTRSQGSGAYVCAGTSQPCIGVGRFTTAQRNAFTWNTGSTLIFNSSSGGLQFWDGGSWLSIATQTGSFTNASLSEAGKVQMASTGSMLAGTAVGSTGAPNAVWVAYLTSVGGVGKAGKVPVLNDKGYLSGSLLTRNATSYLLSGSVVLDPRTLSGAYVVGANEKMIPTSPIGSMMMWPTDTPPTGWLLADGTCHTRTGTGAALFAVIGTTFQASCASNTFGVPDMRGRFALGQDDMGGTSANRVTDTRADTIGSGSGSQSIDLSHTHALSTTESNVTEGGGSTFLTGPQNTNSKLGVTSLLSPYLTMNYIIRSR